MSKCSGCDALAPEGARFCPFCGTSLVTRIATQERRTVTALFADMVGSTSLTESVDPEVMRRVVGRFFEAVSAEITRFDGVLEKFMGDAVLGLFGVRISHEDDPERAVRAALSILEAVSRLDADLIDRYGRGIGVRIGIESGEVIVGDPYAGSTMATGDAINVAARLEQHAGPGEILVGPGVRAATRRVVEYRSGGELDLKGKSGLVPAWTPVRVRSQEEALVATQDTPMVGRAREQERILALAQRALGDRRATILSVLGAPGVGKSRVVFEAGRAMEAAGWELHRGRCLPYGEGVTYGPLAQILTAAAGGADASGSKSLAGISADAAVGQLLGFAIGLVEEAPVGGPNLEREIAWAFRTWLEERAQRHPVCLVIEDLHLAQPALLDLLEYLGSWIREAPVLIVCTSRPEFLESRPAWPNAQLDAERIAIRPLEPGDAAELLSALLRRRGLSEALADQVLERTEGNPLFLEETVRMLEEEGLVASSDPSRIASIRIPESVEALVRARLDTVPRGERSSLQAASVVGRQFSLRVLSAVAEDPAQLSQHIGDAIVRELVLEEDGRPSEPRYKFSHGLIRDAAYSTLPKERRVKLHLAVARELAGGETLAVETVEIRAHHLEEASGLVLELEGRPDRQLAHEASELLRTASVRARGRGDYRAAQDFAERAHQVAVDPADLLESQWLTLESTWLQSDWSAALELGRTVAEEARRAGRPELEGRARLVQTYGILNAPPPEGGGAAAVANLRRAQEILSQCNDLRYLHEAEIQLGNGAWWGGDFDEAQAHWQRARSIGADLGNVWFQCNSLILEASALRSLGRSQEAEGLFRSGLELAEASGNRLVLAQARAYSGPHIALSRSLEAGLALLREAIPVLEEAGSRSMLGWALHDAAMVLQLAGRPEEALMELEVAAAVASETGETGLVVEIERHRAESLLDLGRVEEAESHALRGTQEVAPDDVFSVAHTAMALGRVRSRQDRPQEADSLLTRAIEVIEESGHVAERWQEYLAMAEHRSRTGDVEAGRKWADLALANAMLSGPEAPLHGAVSRRLQAAGY